MIPARRLARALPDRRGLPRVVWLLVLGRAVNRLGAFTLPFLTVALTQRFGASIEAAGGLMAAFGAATVASRLAGGRLADRIGRRSTIVVGLVLTAAAQLGLAAAPGLTTAALAVVLLGLAFEIYEPASQALVADAVPAPSRPAAYGLMSAALAVAAVAAGLLAAALGAVDLRLLFVVDALSCLACAALLSVALPARGTDPQRSPARSGTGASPWRDPVLLALLGSGAVFASVYLQLSATLGLTLVSRGLPGSRVGLLLLVSAVTLLLGQPLLSRSALARTDPWRALSVGYVLLGAGLLANGFATTVAQFASATVLWSIGDLLLLGRAYALVAELAPDEARARYFSVYGLSWGVAAVVGPLLGTQILLRTGPIGLWITCALVCVLLAAAQPAIARLAR